MTRVGQNQIYYFDGFVFEQARGILRNPNGLDLSLRPKAMALLVHLLTNPGHLLHRDDLLNQMWPGLNVTDDSLTQCVSELRRAFGERALHILRTVPRQGYVMAAAVECQAAPPALTFRLTDLINLRRAPLALLPFECLDPDPTCQHLAISLISDLQGELTTFEELRLVPNTHPTAYRVHGKVRSSGSVLRVLVCLQASDGTTLWADRFEAPRVDDAELDKAVIGRLAVNLARWVNHEDLLRARDADLASLSARQLRLLGADYFQRTTEADTLRALHALERAIALDPGFALAYAWLTYAVQRAYTCGWGSLGAEAARDRALALAQQAVQLEPGSALCQSRLAWALVVHERWQEAVATARRAVAGRHTAPWEVWVTAAEVLAHAGEPEEAIVLARRALVLDPLCPPVTYSVLGRALLLAGYPDEALSELQWCVGQLWHHHPTYDALVVAAMEAGQPKIAHDAMAALRRLDKLNPPEVRWLLCRLADVERYRRAFAIAGQDGLHLVSTGRRRA